LEQPHDLVIDVDGARQPVDLVEALERGHPVTGSPEHPGEGLADGPVPDDRNVGVSRHPPATA
jgi:hypothetical protein